MLAMRRAGGARSTRHPKTHDVPLQPRAPQPIRDKFLFTSILNFFIKSRTALFKSLPACYKLVKQ